MTCQNCAAKTEIPRGARSWNSLIAPHFRRRCRLARSHVANRKRGNIGSMWAAYVKTAAGRSVSPRYGAKLPARLNPARVGSWRRTSTAGGEAAEAEVMEPDTEVLKTLVCPLSKVWTMGYSTPAAVLEPIGRWPSFVWFPLARRRSPTWGYSTAESLRTAAVRRYCCCVWCCITAYDFLSLACCGCWRGSQQT